MREYELKGKDGVTGVKKDLSAGGGRSRPRAAAGVVVMVVGVGGSAAGSRITIEHSALQGRRKKRRKGEERK